MAFNFYLDGEFISIAIVLLSDPSSVFFVIFLPIPFIRSLIRSFFFVFFFLQQAIHPVILLVVPQIKEESGI